MLLVLKFSRSAARSWCLGALFRQLWRQLFRYRRLRWGPRGWMRRPRRLWPSFQICASLFLDLQEVGFASLQWEDSAAVEAARVVMKAAFRLSVQRLGMLASTMRRWMRWACEHFCSCGMPGCSGFGGIPCSMLVWVVLRLPLLCFKFVDEPESRAQWPLQHFMVQPFRFHAQGHATQKAVELQPWEFVNLIRLAASLTGTPQLLLSFIIQSGLLVHSFCTFSAVPLGGGP